MADTASATHYVILQRIETGKKPTPGHDNEEVDVASFNQALWKHCGGVAARSAEAALRAYSGLDAGTFVAIPARSWKPVKVAVQTQTKITLS